MSNVLTLQNTINFALTYVNYSPLTAGAGQEPAISIASMIRNSMLMPSQTWYFNRNEISFSTVVGQQDYDESISANGNDFSWAEKISLTDDAGNIFEIKDVYNNAPLAVSAFQQRPSAVSAQVVSTVSGAQHVKFRFLGVPDKIYTVTVTYQKLSPQFGPFFVTNAGNAAGGNTAYTGSFDPISFPVGAVATIFGFATSANNGAFVVVSCTATTLTVVNAGGVAEAKSAFAVNLSWDPIPDQFSDVYNNLFLAEALAAVDDARSQLYRQRGVAAYVARADGFTETQKNIFAQLWLARAVERQSVAGLIQLGTTGRGV